MLWKIPNWTPLLLVGFLGGAKLLTDYGPPDYAEHALELNIVAIIVALPLGLAMLIRKWLRARYREQTQDDQPSSHTGFWLVLFALVPIVAAGMVKGLLGPNGPAAQIDAMLIAMLGAVFLFQYAKKHAERGHRA